MNNNLTSLIAFKDRGNFGDNKYRGNCSGKVIQALLRHFRPQFVADFMRGSDTTGDVCKYENVKYNPEFHFPSMSDYPLIKSDKLQREKNHY